MGVDESRDHDRVSRVDHYRTAPFGQARSNGLDDTVVDHDVSLDEVPHPRIHRKDHPALDDHPLGPSKLGNVNHRATRYSPYDQRFPCGLRRSRDREMASTELERTTGSNPRPSPYLRHN